MLTIVGYVVASRYAYSFYDNINAYYGHFGLGKINNKLNEETWENGYYDTISFFPLVIFMAKGGPDDQIGTPDDWSAPVRPVITVQIP